MRRIWMSRQRGNVGDLMVTGVCILAMTVVMLAYMDNIALLGQKTEVSQLARKYILKMETVGYLTPQDRAYLTEELTAAGATAIDYGGTTINPVVYGETITLQIEGVLEGEYTFEEKRVSTAKN